MIILGVDVLMRRKISLTGRTEYLHVGDDREAIGTIRQAYGSDVCRARTPRGDTCALIGDDNSFYRLREWLVRQHKEKKS